MNEQVRTFEPTPQSELDWLGTAPIPARAYYDPGYFEAEREAVFRRSWINVGHVCELPEPGNFIRRELEVVGASILVVRGKDGAIRAFHNVCTHRGTQLVEAESGRQGSFSCPYHRWTFAPDGSLMAAPDFERFHVDKADCALPAIALEICAGLIFVNLAKQPASLRASLGELAERMEALPVARATTFTEYVYDIEANWKLAYDNFQENYHLRFVHPKSGGAGIGGDNPFGYPVRYSFHGPHRTQTIWINPAPGDFAPMQVLGYGRAAAAAAAKGLPLTGANAEYFALFPNFFLFGSLLSPFSHVIYPIDATRSRGVFRLYWVGDDASASERFAREYMMASVRDVHCEDRNVILAGQKGLSSGALEHIHFQSQEALCRHLFNVIDAMIREHAAGAPA